MNQQRKPKKVKAPEGITSPYLTSGKEYDVFDAYCRNGINYYMFKVIDDDGDEITTAQEASSHLGMDSWIVTEYEDENNEQ